VVDLVGMVLEIMVAVAVVLALQEVQEQIHQV
jgi:hypothetical protein